VAESTLSLQYTDLAGEVGFLLGYGRGAELGDPAWTPQQQTAIDSCVKSGLRNFYVPTEGYDWSFMRPTITLDFPLNAQTVTLPDDFGGIEGQITLKSTSSQVSWPIPVMGEGLVRERYSMLPAATGRPQFAALVPLRATTATAGQRQQLFFFPAADQGYTIQFSYYVLPDYLNKAFPYAMGGMQHIETILESCLAVAERRLDNQDDGPHARDFRMRMAASIAYDRKLKPQKLGYNGDKSDMTRLHKQDQHWLNLITVHGVQYALAIILMGCAMTLGA